MTGATTSTAILSHPLKAWERVELIVGEPPTSGRYLARIQDFVNGGIVITEPEFLEGSTLLREDINVLVLITREDAIYQFSSRIKRMLSRETKEYLLTPPRRFERVQRRMFVRVEAVRKMAFAIVTPFAEWKTPDDHLTWEQSQTSDLSGGGLSFRISEQIPLGTPVLLRLEFFKEFGLEEFVVSVARRNFGRESDWLCGAEFVLDEQLSLHLTAPKIAALPSAIGRFDRNAQNRLASHVFNMQVNLRQKGLL